VSTPRAARRAAGGGQPPASYPVSGPAVLDVLTLGEKQHIRCRSLTQCDEPGGPPYCADCLDDLPRGRAGQLGHRCVISGGPGLLTVERIDRGQHLAPDVHGPMFPGGPVVRTAAYWGDVVILRRRVRGDPDLCCAFTRDHHEYGAWKVASAEFAPGGDWRDHRAPPAWPHPGLSAWLTAVAGPMPAGR
jgi:hypothetical protein